MYLVGVHAQVSAAAPLLLERTLNALVEDVAEEALRCFRQVKKFGMGGMLRVRPSLCPLDDMNLSLLRRPPWRSSSYTRRSHVLSLRLRPRPCLSFTTRSHKLMPGNPAMKTCRLISMASRERWRTPGVRRVSSSCVSGKQSRRTSLPVDRLRLDPRSGTAKVQGKGSEKRVTSRDETLVVLFPFTSCSGLV